MKTKIAFFKEITGDLDSPLEIYLKFENDKNSYFFESNRAPLIIIKGFLFLFEFLNI